MIQSSSPAQRLWAEAGRLAAGLDDVLEKVLQLSLEVVALLADQQAARPHERANAIYAEAIEKQGRFAGQMRDLSVDADRIQALCRPSDYAARIEEIQEALRRVDIGKLADGDLIALCEHAAEAIETMPDTVGVPLASAGISRFVLVYSHAEALSAYLDHPSLGEQVLDGTAELVKAFALDVGGSVVFPFLGTLQTMFELATPQAAKDAAKMKTATAEWSRLFAFIDRLDALLRAVDLAEQNARAAEQAITKADLDFERNARWLTGLLEAVG